MNRKIYQLIIIIDLIINLNNIYSQNVIWVKNIGGKLVDNGWDIVSDVSGNIFVTGNFSGDSVDFDPDSTTYFLNSVKKGIDFFIAKYSSSGKLIWAKAIGGDSSDYSKKLLLDVDGNLFIAGRFFSKVIDFDPGPDTFFLRNNKSVSTFFIAKYTSSGDLSWVIKTDNADFSDCNTISLDMVGNVIATGFFTGSKVDFNPGADSLFLNALSGEMFIVKYNNYGQLLWAKNTGGLNITPREVKVDSLNNIYITGEFKGINIDFDPGVGLAKLSSNGLEDVFIAKYNAMGEYLWAFSIGGKFSDLGYSLFPHKNSIYITGTFQDTIVNFDPGVEKFYLNSNGKNDIYIAKYTTEGKFCWAKNFGSRGYDVGRKIVIDNNEEIYLFGTFNDTVDFNPGIDLALVQNTAGVYFIARYDTNCNFKSVINFGGGLVVGGSIYTNHTNLYFIGSFSGFQINFHPGIYDSILLSSAGDKDICFMKLNKYLPLKILSVIDSIKCKGGIATIQINVSGGKPPYKFYWNDGDSVNLRLLPSGNYYLTLIDNSGISLYRKYSLSDGNSTFFENFKYGTTIADCNDTLLYIANVDPFSVVEWKILNGFFVRQNFDSVWVYSVGCPGIMRIQFIEKNKYGCISDTVSMDVGLITNYNKINNNEIKIWPVPAFSELNILFPFMFSGKIELINENGIIFYEKVLNSHQGLYTINVNFMLPNIYFIKFTNGKFKLIKKIFIL